ncbi:MAG: peptidoglycan DD-metalloendopeptidase family protein, partial [Defluviitaleaceae bacterium]|nr:peptidoglycan DD-metalloendopeptidase family protein [Defluviitaleaceae bacterium]
PGFGNLYLQLQGPLTQEERGGEWKLCVIIIGADGSEIFRDCTHTVTLTIRTPGGNNNNNNDDNDNDDNDNDNDNDNDGNEPWWPVLPPPSPTLTVLSNDDIRIFVNGYGFPLNQPTRVQNGTQITLTFNAPSGYRLESATFSIGELTSQNSENGQYTLVFTMPNFNTEVTLVFEPISGSLPNNDFPLHWPSDSGEVTLWFGIVDSVYRAVHEGIDIQNILGTPVYSVADGVISDIYDSPLGRVIVTDFTFNGRDMQARHINVDAITVRIGDTVTRGQTIGVKGLNPSHEEIVKGKLEIQLLNADGQKVDPMNFMIRPYYDVDYLTRPMAYSMLPTNRARAYLTTLDMHRRFMANLDLNQDLGEVYLWRAAYNFVISQKDHITPDEFAEAGYLAWDGETRTATFQFQDIFMQWSAPIVEVSEIETWGVTPVADDVGIGRIENDRMIISPNPFVTFRYDVEWRMFSHPETDTEMFISTERLPSFGDFENVFVGVTRFLGNPYGNIYVLDGGEWYLQGSVLLVDIGIVGIQERILPPMLLPPMLVRWVRNTIIGNAQDDVDNPFMDDYFGEFAWKKLLALSASTTSHEAALQVKELTLPMSSLRSSAMITQEQLDRIEEWMMEWEAELVAESHSEEIMPLHTIGLSLDVTRTLSSADGVGDIRFALTAENGLNAQITAAIFYNDTDYAMREDAFRHWYWNFSTAIDLMLGTRVAHVITTNHEWTGRLIGRVTEYYNNELDNLDWWQTSMTARRRALAFSENERNNELELIGSNFNAFTSFFTDEDIMDFYNNEVGRVDAVTYRWSLSTVFTIFGNAWNDGRLVKTYRQEYIAGYGYRVREGGVTYEIQRAVFDNNWWRN